MLRGPLWGHPASELVLQAVAAGRVSLERPTERIQPYKAEQLGV